MGISNPFEHIIEKDSSHTATIILDFEVNYVMSDIVIY